MAAHPRGAGPGPATPPSAGSGLTVPSYERPSGVHPPLGFAGYHSTALRAPRQPLVMLPQGLTEITGPLLGAERVTPADADLTAQHAGEPLGQRITLSGRVLDSDGRPVPDTLIEVWQANAARRYRHRVDDHPAPLDRTDRPGAAAGAGRAGEEHRQDRDAGGDPERAGGSGRCVGVTSIGRDGEEHDVIDARIDKPRIVLEAGSLVASTDALVRASGARARAAGADRRENPARRSRDREARRAGRDRSRRPERRRGSARGERGDDRIRRRAGADRRLDRSPRGLLAGGRRRTRDGHGRGPRARTSRRSWRPRRTRSIWSGCRAGDAPVETDADGGERAHHAGAPTRAERRAGGDRRAAARASEASTFLVEGALSERFLEGLLAARTERAGRELRIVAGDPTKVFLSRRGPDWYRRQGIAIEVRRRSI